MKNDHFLLFTIRQLNHIYCKQKYIFLKCNITYMILVNSNIKETNLHLCVFFPAAALLSLFLHHSCFHPLRPHPPPGPSGSPALYLPDPHLVQATQVTPACFVWLGSHSRITAVTHSLQVQNQDTSHAGPLLSEWFHWLCPSRPSGPLASRPSSELWFAPVAMMLQSHTCHLLSWNMWNWKSPDYPVCQCNHVRFASVELITLLFCHSPGLCWRVRWFQTLWHSLFYCIS